MASALLLGSCMSLGGTPVAPCIQPTIELLRSPSLSGRTIGAVRSLVIGSQWPQARLAAAGLADDASCQLCEAAEGTLFHRAWLCPAHDLLRRTWFAPGTVRPDRVSTTLLFGARGLAPALHPWLPQPLAETVVHVVLNPPDGFLSGSVFLDSSASHPRDPLRSRAGFAAVQVDPAGCPIGG